jgi:hypothetical protein
MNHSAIRFILLDACEPIHMFVWENKTAKNCADSTGYHLTPGMWGCAHLG